MSLTVTPEMAEVAYKYLHKTAHENKIAEPKLKSLFLKATCKAGGQTNQQQLWLQPAL